MEPETVADGEGGRFAGEDKVPAWWDVFDTSKLGGGGKGEEIDTAEDVRGKIEEECCGGCGWVRDGHGTGTSVSPTRKLYRDFVIAYVEAFMLNM